MNKTMVGPAGVLSAWKDLERDGVRRRDAAVRMGVTEAEIVNELVRAGEARYLRADWQALMQSVPALGDVLALTRNAGCVIEKTGTYRNPELSGDHAGQFTGPEIDLRIFFSHWKTGFAVTHGERKSLEFFGPDGNAVHKIHATDRTSRRDWDELVAAFEDRRKYAALAAVEQAVKSERPDAEVDVEAYRAALTQMTNTHDFFGVIRRFRLSREQALRLGGPAFAQPVEPRSYRYVLQRAAESGLPIMVFVGNPGVIEIHTGTVRRVVEHDGYFNVLDRSFNLHLHEADVARAWITRKPTRDGIISSLEIYDAAGELTVQFFGERHAGESERGDWRDLLAELHIA